MKLRMALLKLFIAPIILALSFGLVGCSGKGSGSQTKVQLRVFQSDGSVSGGLNSAIIDQTANPNVAVYIQVTAPDISPPLEYYFSPAEVSANAGIVTMMVPSGSGRTFILQVLSFGTGETTDTFPGVNYKSSQSADQLTFDLTGAPVVVNVAMEPASTADLEGKIYDGRTGDIMPLNVPCAQPDVHAAFSLGPYSGVSLPVQVTVNSGGDYVIHNVPTDVPITLSALDKTTGASSSISFQFSPSTITKQNIVLDGAKPLVISPTSANVLTNEMVEFTVDGGIPPYSILLTQNNSNGSINQSTPVSADYTSGNIGGEGDVITAIDAVSRGGEGCYNDYIGSDWYAIVVVEYHPLSISPANPTIHASSTIQFVGSGGDGIYSWAIIGSETPGTCQGSTIDSGGLYTPDLNGNCTDTIQLSDYSGDTPVTTTVNVLLGNMAPTITNLPQTVNVRWGKNGSYTVTGNDNLNSPPNNLTWSLGANTCSFTPTINSASGVVNWTCGGVETCTVDVVLTDDGIPPRSDTDTLTINCTDRAPTITSTAPASATEGVLYSYSIICTDPDGDSRSLWLGPADTCGGAVADNHNGTGSYTFTPNEGQGGTACTVGVVCSDTQMTYEAASNVTVAETNQNPSVAVTCPTNTPEDTPTTCSVTASDPDIPNTSPSDPGYLTCSINASTTCAGATMTSCTQVDVPAQGEAAGPGSCNVVVDVVDGWSASAQGNAVITIDEVNQNPSMAVNCPTSVPENATMTCSLTASDPDFPNTLTTDPGHITCSINALTTCTGATITGCTQVSVPAQGEAAGPGSCNVVVDIVDGYSATSQGSATVAIDEVNQNPAGTVNCPTNVPEDAPSVCTLTASDPDLPSTSPGDPGYVTCSIDALTTCVGATVTGCTQVDVPAQGELAGPGSCNVVVDILDGLSATSQSSAVLTIAEVNQNPSVSVSCPTNVFENAPMTCSLTASDPDFPNTLTTDPGYIACSINALTTCTGATITGCTQVDVPAQGEMSPLSCTVVVDVQDGYLATTQGIATVTVDEINQNPSVAVNCPTEVLENSPMVCALAATDSDWPNTLPTDPGYLTCSLNASTSCAGATITGCTQVDVPAQGEMSPPWCTVVVDIQDGWLATGQGSVVVAVSELNQQPSVTVNCPTNAPEDTPTVCSVTASDPDFPNTLPTDPGYITCSLSAFTTCVGATITGCTQVNLPAQGEASGPGSCNVVVDVVDGYLASAQGIASVTIAEVNQNPSVAVTCPTSVAEDTPTVCSLTASDPDLPNTSPGDPGYITCSINASTTCTGATITGCTQVDVPAQGEASGPGSCNVVVDVTDGYTATAQSSASVTITEVNQNPSVAVNCPTSVAENAPMVCPLAASDPDLPNTLPTDPGYITCSLNASTTCTGATITGCTQVNVPAQGEAAGPGSCNVVVDVTDGYSASSQGSALVTITEVNQNPAVAVTCPTNVAENAPMICSLAASDPDLPNTLPSDPGYITCSINASTTCTGATITGCTQVDVPAQGEAAGPGSCNVVVDIMDGWSASSQGSASVTITEANQNPSVAVTCPTSVAEDTPTVCSLTASDPDMPNALSSDPGYITCSLNALTTCTGATITGCTQVNVPAQGEAAGPGSCNVIVDVTDGWSASSQGNASVTITEVNQNPTVAVTCPTSVAEDTPTVCSLTASDPDMPSALSSDPGYITCSLNALTTCTGATITGCTQVNVPAQGEAAGPGSCNVVVNVIDGWSATAQGSASVTITEVNQNPTVAVNCPTNVAEDTPTVCLLTANDTDIPNSSSTDPGYTTCSLNASTTCVGAIITACTQVDVPAQGEAAGPGSCNVVVDVVDGYSATAQGSAAITIDEVNQNPSITVNCPTNVPENAPMICSLTASDPDLPNTLPTDPGYIGCTINASTTCVGATVTGCTQVDVPAQGELLGPGSCSVVVDITDGYLATSQGSAAVTIDEVNQTPSVAINCPTNIPEDAPSVCTLTGSDLDIPNTTTTDPGYTTCSLDALTTCTGATITGCTQVDLLAQGEAAGPGSCNLLVDIVDGYGASSQASVVVTIAEVNQNPSVAVACPSSVPENAPMICSLTASDPDLPNVSSTDPGYITCSLDVLTTCTGATITGCTQVDVPAQGELAGPGTCSVIVDVVDGYSATGQGSASVAITEVDQNPSVAVNCPTNVPEDTPSVCSLTTSDPDLPSASSGDPGYVSCSLNALTTCVGATITGCTQVDVPAQGEAAGPGACNVVVDVTDGYAATAQAGATVTIAEVNQNPSVVVNCPTNIGEDASTVCMLTASDPDLPSVSSTDPGYITCSLDVLTTCTGATITGCTQVDIPAQGEAAGPSSCNIVVDVVDGYSATAQGSATVVIDEVNQNPSVSVNCPTNLAEDASTVCSLTASDPDLPNALSTDPGYITCSLSASTTCTGVTITGCTQVTVPAQGEAAGPGSCNVVVDIQDGYSATAQGSASLTINEVNQNPSVSVSCPASVAEDTPMICSVTASDPDLPNTLPTNPGYITCSLNYSTTCTGATITGCTQVDVPAQGEAAGPGTCTVVVDVVDGYSATAQDGVPITITEVNQNPSVSVFCPASVAEDAATICTVTASDPDIPNASPGDPGYITCSINGYTTCTGATIVGCTKVNVPAQGEAAGPGMCSVFVDIVDGWSATSMGSAYMNITEVNQNPSVSVNCPTNVAENAPMMCSLTASDPDLPNTLPTDPGYITSCSLNASTTCTGATITGCTQVDVPAQGEASGPGSCKVVVDVLDGYVATGQGSATVSITEVNQNPTVSVNCPTNVAENAPMMCSLTASDPDLPNTLPTDPGHITCSINALTTCTGATITGCTQVNVPAQGEAAGPGSCNVVVDVTDGYTATAQSSASVTITEVNQNPTVSVNCPTNVAENASMLCPLAASDLDLPNTLSTDPGYITSCSLNASTTCTGATITGCTQVNVPAQGEAAGPGSCKVVVDVMDGYSATGQGSATVSITEVNQNPTMSVSCPTNVAEDTPMMCTLTASDSDLPNTLPTDPGYIASCSLSASTTCTGATITGCTQVNVPAQGEAAGPGSCNVVVNVLDGYAAAGQGSATVTITEVNQNPSVSVFCPANVAEDAATICTLTASDPDLPNASPGDPGYITCSLNGYTTCTGATIVGCTKVNVPAQGEAAGPGMCSVFVDITDGYSTTSMGSSYMNITEVNQNPSISINCPTSVGEDAPMMCSLTASDPDLPNTYPTDPGYITCSLDATTTCTGATITGCTQVDVPAQGETAGPGSCNVVVDIMDGWSATSQASGSIDINEVNRNPNLILTCPGGIQDEDKPVHCTIAASDPDIPAQTLTCSLDASTTCTGVVVTDCVTDFDIPPQGEAAGPGVCIVQVDATDTKGAKGFDSYTLAIGEVNVNPYWTVTPETKISLISNEAYAVTDGVAMDDDLPNTTTGDPGYLTCAILNNTCSFAITTTNTGAGSVSCDISFTSGPTTESCTFDEVANDGYGGSASQIVSVNVTGVWYVDAGASGANSGTSWADAFTKIQSAMSAALSGDMVWVRQGTFQATLATDEAVITIPNGVRVYGGFMGVETSLADRSIPSLSATTVLDGQNSNCHVVIGNSNTVLDGFTVRNGRAITSLYCTNPWGGGICNSYAYNTYLKNLWVAYNYAQGVGGGIFNKNSFTTVGNSNISHNTSLAQGGGVYNYHSNMYVSYSTISNNYSSMSWGGAFSNSYTTFEMAISTLEYNHAWVSGGAIANSRTDTWISTSEFRYNSSSNPVSNAYGGAISNYGSYGTIEFSLFYENQATSNNAVSFGGAISNASDSPVYISHNTFSYNSAKRGGAISNNYYSAPLISNNIFYENYAQNGGGAIANLGASTPEIRLSQFYWNHTSSKGGAIYSNNSSPVISDNIFNYNNASYSGGAIYTNGYAPSYYAPYAKINNCQFNYNYANYVGGAMYNRNSDAHVDHSSFKNNHCTNSNCYGGAIALYNDSGSVANSTLEYNLATLGGAIAVYTGSPVISNDIIANNHANRNGGGVFTSHNPNIYIENSIILGNSANNGGGGIFNYTTTGGLDCPHVNNTVIANNTAQYGAGLYNYDTQVFVTNSTITGNISTYGDGAGIYVYDRLSTYSVTVKNSIVWGNTSSSGYYNPDIHIPASSPIILNTIVRNSDIGKYVYDSYYHMGYMEPYPGVANIYNDPLFISTPEFNFHLQSDSPCRNAGSPLASMRDPNGSRNDMGAFGGPGTTHFDRDYDGMEDWWEILYGLNPYSALDASQDPDGDGYTNLQEFNNHTNPKVWNP